MVLAVQTTTVKNHIAAIFRAQHVSLSPTVARETPIAVKVISAIILPAVHAFLLHILTVSTMEIARLRSIAIDELMVVGVTVSSSVRVILIAGSIRYATMILLR